MIFHIFCALMMMILGSVPTGQQIQNTNNCTMENKRGITLELCAQREVIGIRGEDVILPCRFHHSKQNTFKDLYLVLYKKKSRKGKKAQNVIIYNSSSNSPRDDFKGRIEPVGNPGEGDGSVRIRNLTMEDQGRYRCRFEWRKSNGPKDGFTTGKNKLTNLHIDVRPKILNISRAFVNSSNSWKLFCEAEAKPEPNITWWSPQGLNLNASQVGVDEMYPKKPQKIYSSLIITNKLIEGKFKCLVQNMHGEDHKYVTFEQKSQKVSWSLVLWTTLLSIVLLLLLLTVGFYIFQKKCKNQGRTGCTGTSDIQEQDQSDDKTYMGLAKTSQVPESPVYERIGN
uniref:sialic acid-binding Ig-like lectin 15 n=1 Tax=Myxine glutinosa TaxID=7769 RepID=UPI00358EAD7C